MMLPPPCFSKHYSAHLVQAAESTVLAASCRVPDQVLESLAWFIKLSLILTWF